MVHLVQQSCLIEMLIQMILVTFNCYYADQDHLAGWPFIHWDLLILVLLTFFIKSKSSKDLFSADHSFRISKAKKFFRNMKVDILVL